MSILRLPAQMAAIERRLQILRLDTDQDSIIANQSVEVVKRYFNRKAAITQTYQQFTGDNAVRLTYLKKKHGIAIRRTTFARMIHAYLCIEALREGVKVESKILENIRFYQPVYQELKKHFSKPNSL